MPKDLHVGALLDVYGEFLNEKQRKILMYYYDEDLSLSEIAENEGVTRQGVADLVKRGKEALYSLEERCGYCEKFSRLKELSGLKTDEALKEIYSIIENL